MRTKTLLILAVVVGLVILVAGTIQLLRVDDSAPSSPDDLRVGETARAGDLEVTVLDASASADTFSVQVRVAGVDDDDGLADFTLLGGAVAVPEPAQGDAACRLLTVEPQTCLLTFDTSGFTGEARVLRVARGEDVRRWVVWPLPDTVTGDD
jgi:hypothetical protein